MKVLLLIFTVSLMSVSTHLFAQNNVNEVIESKKKETQSKSRRRKKVMMCHECGKPEIECECEGEGHGVEEDHKDHHSEE